MVGLVVYVWGDGMSKLYRATSLDDIAKCFRNEANKAKDKMNRETDRNSRNHYAGAWTTWNAAAEMLEQTEIVDNAQAHD